MHIMLLHRSFYNLDIICGYYAAPFRLTKLTFQEYTMNICLHYLAQYIHRTKCLALSFIYRPRRSRVVTSNIWKVHKHTPRWKWENTKPILLKKKQEQKVGKWSKIILASQISVRKHSSWYKFSVPEGGVY